MGSGDAAADRWLDDFFASFYGRRPVDATFIGMHEHDLRLPDYSENGVGDWEAEIAGLLRALDGSDGPSGRDGPARAAGADAAASPRARHRARLSGARALDLTLAAGHLDLQRWELSSHHFHRGNPSTHTGEAVFGLIGLFLTPYAPLSERAEAARARLAVVPAFLRTARDVLDRAPSAWTERAVRECRGAMALLTGGLPPWLARQGALDDGLAAGFDEAARAFAAFQAWLGDDLETAPPEAVACGDEALDLYLRRGHFLDADAEEIARYAADALERADAALASGARELGLDDPERVSEALAERHPSADGYDARYRQVWDAMHALAVERDLLTWPDFPIRYVPRPVWAREAAPDLYFLFYRSPAAFGRPDVHEYLVAPLDPAASPAEQASFLAANNDAVIKLNHVVHHGGIGHHVQNWHAFRAESRIGRVAAVDCASRIAFFCGGTMAEGWACYATDLMAEAGALTPLERVAEHQGRRRMAARAIVDVRLHQGRMSLDEAAAFYRERAGMSEAAARSEAVKNSMFPGAAVMYLMGTDAIHELRGDMERLEGNAFSLRSFHDEFLAYGSVPVSLIAADMRRSRAE